MIRIFVIMTLHMTLYVGIGDGSFATESTDIGIFASMNFDGEICLLCDIGCGVWLCIPISFLWLGIIRLFSTCSVLHCLLPSSRFSLFFKVFFLNQCNDLT
jgi:hypothetical protein